MTDRAWETYRPSNGQEGDIFMDAFCHRCTKESDCVILTRTFWLPIDDPDYPKEWRIPVGAKSWPGEAECTAFEKEPR